MQGSYVYLGATGTGTTDVSTWTQSAPGWKQLTTTFTTGAVHDLGDDLHPRVVRHRPAYYADDLSLVGPGGDPATIPGRHPPD